MENYSRREQAAAVRRVKPSFTLGLHLGKQSHLIHGLKTEAEAIELGRRLISGETVDNQNWGDGWFTVFRSWHVASDG